MFLFRDRVEWGIEWWGKGDVGCGTVSPHTDVRHLHSKRHAGIQTVALAGVGFFVCEYIGTIPHIMEFLIFEIEHQKNLISQ